MSYNRYSSDISHIITILLAGSLGWGLLTSVALADTTTVDPSAMADKLKNAIKDAAQTSPAKAPAGTSNASKASAPPGLPPSLKTKVPPKLPIVPDLPKIAVYVAQGGKRTGPFDEAGLKGLASKGNLTNETLVWKEGMSDWAPASSISELKKIIAATKPAFDPKKYLIGTWETAKPIQVDIGGGLKGDLSGTTTYLSDGTSSTYGTLSVMMPQAGMMNAVITADGTYKITPLTEDSFIVKPNLQVTMNIPGQPPVIQQVNTPSKYTVIDKNTLKDDTGAISLRR